MGAIPPGGEGQVRATFQTNGRWGPATQTLRIVTNDPVTPELPITLKGVIHSDVVIEPKLLTLGMVPKGEEATRSFAVKVNTPGVEVTKVAITDKRFELSLTDGDAKGSATYELKFLGTKELGKIEPKVRVEFGGADHLEGAVWLDVVGDLRYPKSLYFHRRGAGYNTHRLVLSTRSGEPITIESVTDAAERIEFEMVTKTGPRVEATANVGKADKPHPPGTKGEIVVKTTDEDQPVLKIPYTIAPQAGAAPVYPVGRPRSSAAPRPGPSAPRPGAKPSGP